MSTKLESVTRFMQDARPLSFLRGNVSGCPTVQKFTLYATLLPTYTDGVGGYFPQSLLAIFNPLGPLNSSILLAQVAGATLLTTAETFPTTLQLAEDTFLPFVAAQNFAISPPLTSSVTNEPQSCLIGRLTTGLLETQSTQTSITTGSLSGKITTGVLSDLSNVTLRSLAQTNIVQRTTDRKDTYLNVRIEDGIRIIVGPDVALQYNEASVDNVNWYRNVKYVVWPAPPSYPPTVSAAGATGNGTSIVTQCVLLSSYITPTATGSFVVLPIKHTSPYTPPAFDFVLGNSTAAACVVSVVHYYASASGGSPGTAGTGTSPGTAGSPYGITVQTAYDSFYVLPNAEFNATVFSSRKPYQKFSSDPPYIPNALWVGAVVVLTVPASATSSQNLSIYGITMRECINNFTTGPNRVARIDNVAFQQQMTFGGHYVSEFVPTADLAAYVAPSEAQTVTTQELEEVQQSFNDVENKSNRRIYVGAQVESLLNRDKKSGKRNRD